MPAQPQFWNDAKSAQISTPYVLAINAGNSSAATSAWLMNDYGGSLGATTLQNARLRAVAFDGNTRVLSGEPALDEGWLQVSIDDIDNTGDTLMSIQKTAATPLGAGREIILGNIPKNCGRKITWQFVIPAGASNVTQDVYLEVVYDEHVIVLGRGVAVTGGTGVVPAWRDSSKRALTGGFVLSASGATVTVADGWYAFSGSPYFKVQETATLNQTAADGALTPGTSYKARLSIAAGATSVTVTKSSKSAAPTAPALPTDHLYLGDVTVSYQSGGTSIITSANLDTSAVLYDEYHITPGSGTTVYIGGGEAILSNDTRVYHTTRTAFTVNSSGASYIWLLPDGSFTKTTTASSRPVGALRLGVISMSGGSILTWLVEPYRRGFGREMLERDQHILTMRYYGPIADNLAAADWGVIHDDAFLEWYRFDTRVAGDPGGPPAQTTTKLDINGNGGVTLFTSQGTQDRRPAVGASGDIGNFGSHHEVRSFLSGTKLSFDIDGQNGTAVDLLVTLAFSLRR